MTTKARATLRTANVYAHNRQDFDCNGSMSGSHHDTTMGRLPERYRADFMRDMGRADFYVVHSYSTPIAWFANGIWHVPNVKYSVTTSRHLSSLGLGTNWASTMKTDQYVTLWADGR